MRFTRAYVQSPVCGASRMSFYTGRYMQSHGASWNGVPLKVGEMTLGDYLRPLGLDAVLATAAYGNITAHIAGAAHRPLEGWSAYCAGKAGLAMLTRSIALEYPGKVRIFGFSPGTIDTDMQVKIRASGINAVSQIPRANLSPVEHAVRGLLYLCDPASDDLVGQDVSMRDEAFRKRIGLAG